MTYTKNINGRQVFSDCKAIQMPNGQCISNPTAEQITEAGWVEYVPPVVEPTNDAEIEALKMQLQESDYKVIKCAEAMLVGNPMPYDVNVLHEERQAIRDQINELEV